MLTSILSGEASSLSLTPILWCSFASILFGFLIAMTHKYTSRYNKDFLITITILPLLVQVVMLMVNGNLGTSVAILGAFGLIRFRSLPGTSKEILIVFFAMAIGLATGMGHIAFASIITVMGCLLIIFFNKIPLYDRNKNEHILRIQIPEDLDYTTVFNDVFAKYTKNVTLESSKTTNMGSLFDLSYRLILNDDINEKEFIDELRVRNGNLKIILTHPLESESL